MEKFNKTLKKSLEDELSDDEFCSLHKSKGSTKYEEGTFPELISKFISAGEVPAWKRLSTGCKNIDTILNGGIPFNGITEIYGCSGVGKTQIMLQLAIMIQLPKMYNGMERGAVYICTEDAFPAKRFHHLAESFKNKYKLLGINFENNLHIDHVPDYEQLRRCLTVRLPILLQKKNIGLILLDSIAGVFRSENSNSNYTARGHDIVHIADILHNLADKHNTAVVCTNQVQHNLNFDSEEPCLGLVWSNNITYRIRITRYNNSLNRVFQVIFAPDLAEHSTNFTIIESGIVGE